MLFGASVPFVLAYGVIRIVYQRRSNIEIEERIALAETRHNPAVLELALESLQDMKAGLAASRYTELQNRIAEARQSFAASHSKGSDDSNSTY